MNVRAVCRGRFLELEFHTAEAAEREFQRLTPRIAPASIELLSPQDIRESIPHGEILTEAEEAGIRFDGDRLVISIRTHGSQDTADYEVDIERRTTSPQSFALTLADLGEKVWFAGHAVSYYLAVYEMAFQEVFGEPWASALRRNALSWNWKSRKISYAS